jgi:hypothetical protein
LWALDIVRGPRLAAAPVVFLAVVFLALVFLVVFFAVFLAGRELFFAVLFFAGGMRRPLGSPVVIVWNLI